MKQNAPKLAVAALVLVGGLVSTTLSRQSTSPKRPGTPDSIDFAGAETARTRNTNAFTAPDAQDLDAVDYAALIARYRAELSAIQTPGKRREIAGQLRELGVSAHMRDLGKGEIAVDALTVAADVFRELHANDRLCLTLVDLADALVLRGETDRAVAAWNEAAALPGASDDAVFLMRAGGFYAGIGDHARASASLERALVLARNSGKPGDVAQALRARGGLFLDRERLDDAVADLSESAAILAAKSDFETRAAVLGTWGDALLRKGDHFGALRLYREGLAVWESRKQTYWTGVFYGRLAGAELARGHDDQARALATKSLALLENSNGPVGKILPLTVLGNIARDRGDITKAVTFHDNALKLARATRNPRKIRAAVDALILDLRKSESPEDRRRILSLTR